MKGDYLLCLVLYRDVLINLRNNVSPLYCLLLPLILYLLLPLLFLLLLPLHVLRYNGYALDRHMYWWESVVMLRKLSIVLVGVLVSDPFDQVRAA